LHRFINFTKITVIATINLRTRKIGRIFLGQALSYLLGILASHSCALGTEAAFTEAWIEANDAGHKTHIGEE